MASLPSLFLPHGAPDLLLTNHVSKDFLGTLGSRIGRPAAILIVPGLIVLVPGALGLSGIRALIERDALVGLQTIVDAALIGGGLVAGLLVSNLVVPPRTSL